MSVSVLRERKTSCRCHPAAETPERENKLVCCPQNLSKPTNLRYIHGRVRMRRTERDTMPGNGYIITLAACLEKVSYQIT